MTTVADLVRAREGDEATGLQYEDLSWTYDLWVQCCAQRAAFLLDTRRDGPFHVGVLLDNVPEFPMWLGAAALVGATVVGINPTRRGDELARDIRHTDCQLIVTETTHAAGLEGLDLGLPSDRVLVVEHDEYHDALAQHEGAPLPDAEVHDEDRYLLLFTSGTSGAPKAVVCTQGRLGRIGAGMAAGQPLTSSDACYLVMPLYHSNCLMAGWSPALAGGATQVLRRKFSASAFIDDVHRYRVTYFNYVGKPLSYILATPEKPTDADNTLRIAFGNEGSQHDIERFARRFGCVVIDGYGSTEGGAFVTKSGDTPSGALGPAVDGMVVLDPDSEEECPVARFDEDGRMLNADEAVGELVNKDGAAGFEGYYKNDEANAARLRNDWYWTGDLAYKDAEGFLWFAGRDAEWLRVDGENFAAAPVERILSRHPDVVLVAVYGVPDVDAGDQVMAALQLRPGATFDAGAFDAFLGEQSDLGTKWPPRFVRVNDELPVTTTNKVLKRELRRQRWECDDPVWWRPARGEPYRRLAADDIDALRKAFEQRGRLTALEV